MFRISVFTILFMLAIVWAGFYAQGQADRSAAPGAGPAAPGHPQISPEQKQQWLEMHRAMMEKRQKAMEQMKQADQELQQKVETMNKATGEQKINAMADVINQLVAEHRKMRERMMQMPMPDMGGGMGMPGMGGGMGAPGGMPPGHGGMMMHPPMMESPATTGTTAGAAGQQ